MFIRIQHDFVLLFASHEKHNDSFQEVQVGAKFTMEYVTNKYLGKKSIEFIPMT